jgi:hypothetical protein
MIENKADEDVRMQVELFKCLRGSLNNQVCTISNNQQLHAMSWILLHDLDSQYSNVTCCHWKPIVKVAPELMYQRYLYLSVR